MLNWIYECQPKLHQDTVKHLIKIHFPLLDLSTQNNIGLQTFQKQNLIFAKSFCEQKFRPNGQNFQVQCHANKSVFVFWIFQAKSSFKQHWNLINLSMELLRLGA